MKSSPGERRWQAAKLAGLADIPTIVRELSDKEATAVALIEIFSAKN